MQDSYLKDTTDFIYFVEKTKVPANTILVLMDVTSHNKLRPQKKFSRDVIDAGVCQINLTDFN